MYSITCPFAGYSDSWIVLTTLALSSLSTVASVAPEFLVKLLQHRCHLTPIPFFLYLGADTTDLPQSMVKTSPWFLYTSLISVGFFALALCIYKVVKAR